MWLSGQATELFVSPVKKEKKTKKTAKCHDAEREEEEEKMTGRIQKDVFARRQVDLPMISA